MCEEARLNLAYRRFCGLGLEGNVPEGLVGGDGLAVDASLIRADANRHRSAEGSEQIARTAMAATRRSAQEYLDTLDDTAWGAASEVTPKFVAKSIRRHSGPER